MANRVITTRQKLKPWRKQMITKSLIAAAAVAASLTAFAPAQQAQAGVDIDVHLGGGLGFYPGYGGGYGYPVYEPHYGGISCKKGRKIVDWSGFHNVQAYDCSAPVYQYRAWKNGNKYRVRVNLNGNIIGVKKI
jgi:hypothetical protein